MNPSIKYENVIKVPLPYGIRNNTRIDIPLGKKVFFQIEIPARRKKIQSVKVSCSEIYDFHDVPFLVLHIFLSGSVNQLTKMIKSKY